MVFGERIIIGFDVDDQASTKSKAVADNIQKDTANMAKSVSVNFKQVALGATSAASGIVSFATSFSTLDRASLQARRAQQQYEKAQDRVNDLIKKGAKGTKDYELAVKDVELAHDKAALAQNNYNDMVLNFATGIAPQMISIAIGIQKTIQGLGITTLAYTTSTRAQLGAVTASTYATATGFRAMGLAMKAALLSNPIGIALLAITTLITLVATNTFGLRDAFFSLGKGIYEFLNVHFKPLADAMKWFYDTVLKPLGQLLGVETPEQVGKASDSVNDFGGTMSSTSKSVSTSTGSMKRDINSFAVSTDEIFKRWKGKTGATIHILEGLQSIGTEITRAKNSWLAEFTDFGVLNKTLFSKVAKDTLEPMREMGVNIKEMLRALVKEGLITVQEASGLYRAVVDDTSKGVSAMVKETTKITADEINKLLDAQAELIKRHNEAFPPAGTARNGVISNKKGSINPLAGRASAFGAQYVSKTVGSLPGLGDFSSSEIKAAKDSLFMRGYRGIFDDDPLLLSTLQFARAQQQSGALGMRLNELGIPMTTQSTNALPSNNKWGATGFFGLNQQEFDRANPFFNELLGNLANLSPSDISKVNIEIIVDETGRLTGIKDPYGNTYQVSSAKSTPLAGGV